MLRSLAKPITRLVERWLPSSLVFAIILTFIVALLALVLTDSGPIDIVQGWGDGLSGLLAFIAQISITLIMGYTLAHTGPVHRLLTRIAQIPSSPAAAYSFVVVVTALASLLSWGLGLIVAGIMSVQVGTAARARGMRVHYPLLVASGYSGYVVWHMGYSGSGPLAASTPGSFFEDLAPLVPVTQTTFATWNLIAIVVTVIVIVITMLLLAPGGDDPIIELPAEANPGEHDSDVAVAATPDSPPATDAPIPAQEIEEQRYAAGPTPAERIDGARILTLALGVMLVVYLVVYFAGAGFALTLDVVNWSFLAAILLLVGSPRKLAELITDAGKTVGQILLQYPLYAGIIGIMTATGLVEVFSSFFVGISTPGTLGFWAFISGGIVNMFVPSGGGQFAIQAPIFIRAADELRVTHPVVIMGIAYGDQWTNMVQPFWTIPLLAIAGLKVRDVLGYTTITLLVTGIVFAATLFIVGAG